MTKKEFKQGIFVMGRCNVVVSVDNGKYHLSISTPYESPSYEEIKEARYRFVPDEVYMAQIFPPKGSFVNVHPFCHHLWEIEAEKAK